MRWLLTPLLVLAGLVGACGNLGMCETRDVPAKWRDIVVTTGVKGVKKQGGSLLVRYGADTDPAKLRAAYIDHLEGAGYRVVLACDGADAFRLTAVSGAGANGAARLVHIGGGLGNEGPYVRVVRSSQVGIAWTPTALAAGGGQMKCAWQPHAHEVCKDFDEKECRF